LKGIYIHHGGRNRKGGLTKKQYDKNGKIQLKMAKKGGSLAAPERASTEIFLIHFTFSNKVDLTHSLGSLLLKIFFYSDRFLKFSYSSYFRVLSKTWIKAFLT